MKSHWRVGQLEDYCRGRVRSFAKSSRSCHVLPSAWSSCIFLVSQPALTSQHIQKTQCIHTLVFFLSLCLSRTRALTYKHTRSSMYSLSMYLYIYISRSKGGARENLCKALPMVVTSSHLIVPASASPAKLRGPQRVRRGDKFCNN